MFLNKGKITEDLVTMVMKWRHSGFNIFMEIEFSREMKVRGLSKFALILFNFKKNQAI
jgi:hypothetical protein